VLTSAFDAHHLFPARRIRVAVVDDSVVVRGLFARWLTEMPEVDLVGVHRNSIEALRQMPSCRPDVVLLDIEMPEMDGLTALPLLLQAVPEARVLVVSALTIRGADLTLKCLMRGASDYLSKPTTMAKVSTTPAFKQDLQARVRALGNRVERRSVAYPGPLPPPVRAPRDATPQLLVIGASTGGPAAITALLAQIPEVLPGLPVVVGQHMPATFTTLFADHLRRHARLDACEISGGEVLRRGVIHVVRGDGSVLIERAGAHFVARRGPGTTMALHPSIDLIFASAADAAGPAALGVILTGAGNDGAAGAARIVAAGGAVFAQSPESCTLSAMPSAVCDAGLASVVGDIAALGRSINRHCRPIARD